MPEIIQCDQPPSGACGRADLLRALAMAECDESRENALASVLGFIPILSSGNEIIIDGMPATISISATSGTVSASPQSNPIVFRPFYLVSLDIETSSKAWQVKQPDSDETGMLTDEDQACWSSDHASLEASPIVPWARLWPRLRAAVAQTRAASLDVSRLAEHISRGLIMRRLPYKTRLSWPNPLPVVFDFSDRLTPYWDDWHWLRRQLKVRFKQQICCYRLHGVPQQDLQPLRNGRPEPYFVDWPPLGLGDTLLLVSDLGMVDATHPWPATCWQNKLADYRRRGVRVIVLTPASVRHLQPALVNVAEVIRLSPDSDLRPLRRMPPMAVTPAVSKHPLSAAGAMLLAMMSVATRVEPALLRALRHCLPDHSRDVGLEAEVWCYPQLDTAATACALTQWAVQSWRQKFAHLPEALQQRTLDCLRGCHAGLSQAIHNEEILLWRHLANPSIAEPERKNVQYARDFFMRLKNSLAQKATMPGKISPALLAQFADRHVQWVAPSLGNVESYVTQLYAAVERVEPERTSAGLPVGVDPVAWLKALPDIALKRVDLLQGPDLSLIMRDIAQAHQTGYTRLATIDLDRVTLLRAWGQDDEMLVYQQWNWVDRNLRNVRVLPTLLEIDKEQQPITHLYLHTGQQRLNFETFNPPSWATAWGQDIYGFYADLQVQNIVQRFRWIAPGTFLMGSPTSEAQRRDSETQHEVTLTQGYWLADSACTQALWAAVTEKKPSRFIEDVRNPVENVSWEEIKDFIGQLNKFYADLQARLPTEAEWEYACRAGTITPFSYGENITSEQVNYDGNYPYADGKKGLFRQQTVPVKSLPANRWGLYEMHGNVWEWCADGYGEYPAESVIDPTGSGNSGARVLRGGSWGYDGRRVRSAYRYWIDPAYRNISLGFRLALGHAGGIKQASL